jgi:hypothetical protein
LFFPAVITFILRNQIFQYKIITTKAQRDNDIVREIRNRDGKRDPEGEEEREKEEKKRRIRRKKTWM